MYPFQHSTSISQTDGQLDRQKCQISIAVSYWCMIKMSCVWKYFCQLIFLWVLCLQLLVCVSKTKHGSHIFPFIMMMNWIKYVVKNSR